MRLLQRLKNYQKFYSISGDLEEFYREIYTEKGPLRAYFWFWYQVVYAGALYFKSSIYWSSAMFNNYLKILVRTIKRQKFYSFVNIAGLSIGMACTILILLLVRYENSYDKFHKDFDRIYRIYTRQSYAGDQTDMAPTMLPLAPALKEDFPEIEYAVRISDRRCLVASEAEKFYEKIIYTEPSFFKIFSFSLLKGNPETVLNEPYSIVITDNFSEKYFGDTDPVGKTLRINNENNFKVTGVLKKLPYNSHLRSGFFASFSSFPEEDKDRLNDWTSFSNDYTYIKLMENTDPKGLEQKLPDFIERHIDSRARDVYSLFLQPLKSIRFSNLDYDFAPVSDSVYLKVFTILAGFILLIACINFMNLSTARSSARAKEIGIRKVTGAGRTNLIKQLMSESIFLSFIALVFSLIIICLILPEFNRFLVKDIKINFFEQSSVFILLVAVALTTGLISGSYPAFYISSFLPVNILRGIAIKSGTKGYFRNSLIVFQFSLSILFLIGTVTVFKQVDFMKNKDLGFNDENMVVIRLPDSNSRERYEILKRELLENPAIISASASSGTPGSGRSSRYDFYAEGYPESEAFHLFTLSVDYDFIDNFGIRMVNGRIFSKEYANDLTGSYIINEAAVKKFGWDEPLGKILDMGGKRKGEVIGIMKDFHYYSIRTEIFPVIMTVIPKNFEYLSVKIKEENTLSALKFIESKWKEFSPNYPFTHFMPRSKFDNYYRYEERIGKLLTVSTVLAVFICCLGLLGLISYMINRRAREISIRKVVGASTTGLTVLLSKTFVKLAVLSNIIAWPVAYLSLKSWLNNFPYHSNMTIGIFLAAGSAGAVIMFLTVSVQIIRTAAANPVKNLKYE